MTTYQTPGELGVSFYNGSTVYNSASAPEWAVRLLEDKIEGEQTGVYCGEHKDCLSLVGTSENEIAFAARLLIPWIDSGHEGSEIIELFFGVDPLDGYDDDDPHRCLSFVKKYCPNHYDEAVALFEQDLAKWGGNGAHYCIDFLTNYLSKVGDPVGMKCVYYEWEKDDMYAGVLIHSGSEPFGVFKIMCVPREDEPGTYNVYHNPDISVYAFENDCWEYDYSTDPTGINELQNKVREFNEFCKELNNVETPDDLRALGNKYKLAARMQKNVKAGSAKQATELVEIYCEA